ncbi:short chain dehydrogenase [Gulosibacter sp. 10]|uniref:short chain dehydrogenase n=1 Tax=Gulosibacter sp. 10 TaxID=1255570 RepID=UPI00097F0163|nr:short chain dehydrogenase [Gulosibacter sp. 10]SJM62439.1 short chain dehydrogenase [Gulosibacter sp. 10]
MKILLIGATGHVGSAARQALEDRHEIIAASRSSEPGVDLLDPDSVARLFERVGTVDAVISAFGAAPVKPFAELAREDYLQAFERKALSQIDLVRIGAPHVADGGSFTLTTGVLSREPVPRFTAAAMANGAVEAYVMAVAPELPRGIRINAVSPSVLQSAPDYHAAFRGFVPVPSERVGAAFARCVEGSITGRALAVD